MTGFNLKLAIRNLLKNSRYTIINVLGLAVGMAAFILLSLFINFHLKADKDIPHVDRLYRIDQEVKSGGQTECMPCSPFPLRNVFQQTYPEIEKAARMQFCGEFLSSDKEHTYMEQNGRYVEPDFLDLFGIELVQGNPATALNESNSILLTEEMAKKYFGEKDVIGQGLKFMSNVPCKVTGVYKALPQNRTDRPDFLVSYTTLYETLQPDIESNWDWCMAFTFLRFKEGTDPAAFEEKIHHSIKDHYNETDERLLLIWPYTKVHFQFNRDNDNRGMFYLIGMISIFILVIASINFTNLATAYSSIRMREIGVRKISGAYKFHIIRQFMGESLLVAFVSLAIGIAIAELFLPSMSELLTDNLVLLSFDNIGFLLFIALVTLVLGLVSGSYPAFYLSALKPDLAIKGTSIAGGGSQWLRRSLVTFQFVISIALIVCTLLVRQQLNHMRNIELGFDKENILIGYLQLTGENNESSYRSLKSNLQRDPRIKHMTWSHNAPFYTAEWWRVRAEGHDPDELFRVQHNHVEYDFLKTFDIKLKDGRNFSPEYASDTSGVALISAETARIMGWENDAIGKIIYNDQDEYRIIGVMEDFHMFSVGRPLDPQFFSYTTRELSWPNSHIIKVEANQDIIEVRKMVTQSFQQYFPEDNIEFTVLDENLEQRNLGFVIMLSQLFGIFAFLAIFIAAIGLYGMVSFVTQRKTKEIGIRKANGALTYELFFLVSREFLFLLLAANVIAIPLAYMTGQLILDQFATKVGMGFLLFIVAALSSLVITFITIGIQIYRASNANPIDSLRFE